MLLGVGSGTSLVTLTSASLAGVEPADAGAASGLVNVIQQVGAALGLAVLVTVFGGVAGHAQLGAATSTATLAGRAAMVHGLDVAFGVGALFALVALVMVAVIVRLPASSVAPSRSEVAEEPAPIYDEYLDARLRSWSPDPATPKDSSPDRRGAISRRSGSKARSPGGRP